MDIDEKTVRAQHCQENRLTGRREIKDAGLLYGAGHKIEIIAVDRLTPNKGNARTHSRKQVRQIADALKRFGFCNPVLIDDANTIIAGHGRVEAAKLLGLTAVPTLRLSHLSDAEKRAYVIADNRLAEKAGWDRETLAIELQALIDIEFEIEVTGFEMGEIEVIFEDAEEARCQGAGPEDEVPERSSDVAVSRRGDLWLLGQHRLLCGDARNGGDYKRLLDDGRAEMVFTDPPYNVKIDGHVCGKGAVHHPDFAMASGEMSPHAFTDFLKSSFDCMVAFSTDGSIHYVCMDWRHTVEMMMAGNAVYSELKNICVWRKSNGGMGSLYRNQHELIFVWKSGTAPHINNIQLDEYGRNRTNVWDYPGISSMPRSRLEELTMHPTFKPVALVADAIKDCSRRNGLVLDPFAGSGTTVIAAEQTGRRARAIEIDPAYVDVAIRRWQTYTGHAATHYGTGQRFEELEEQRKTSATTEIEPAAREAA